MKGQVRFKLGHTEYTFQIEEREVKETLLMMVVLGNPPQYCNECKNDKYFSLRGNRGGDKGYVYIKVHCNSCHAEATLGEYNAGGFFWKKFEKYQKAETPDVPSRDINNDPGIEPF
jgi:hypothetical protein